MAETFRLLIGAKRQVTFPARLLELLSLKEGNEIDVSVEGGQISLVPMVSVPRHLISTALLQKMESRRGAKPSDLSLADFAAWLDSSANTAAAEPKPKTKSDAAQVKKSRAKTMAKAAGG
jgi:bifunctional DNA-binding transcriptional regulator/antitoxin component of YhaV-PrlF toxin-antitoxin module